MLAKRHNDQESEGRRIVDKPDIPVAVRDEKAVRRRVLSWLHNDHSQNSSSSKPISAPPVDLQHLGNLQDAPLQPIGHVSPQAAAAAGPPTPRQRVGQLWKKWKSRALSNNNNNQQAEEADTTASSSSKKSKALSPAVLQRHEQLFDVQSQSSVALTVEPLQQVLDASVLLAASTARRGPLQWDASSLLAGTQQTSAMHATSLEPLSPLVPQLHSSHHAAAAAGAAPQASSEQLVAEVYQSSFYQPSSRTSPKTPQQQQQHRLQPLQRMLPAAHSLPALPTSRSNNNDVATMHSPLRSSVSFSGATSPAATSTPSVTPRVVSLLRHSSGSCAKTCASEHSSQVQGKDSDACLQQQQHAAEDTTCSSSRRSPWPAAQQQQQPGPAPAAATSATTLVRTCHQQSPQRSALQHSPVVLATGRNTQLQQLLQAPKQHQTLQQLQPAPRASTPQLVPAGSALTAYPAVAAALNSGGAGGWLQGRWVTAGSSSSRTPTTQPAYGTPAAAATEGVDTSYPAGFMGYQQQEAPQGPPAVDAFGADALSLQSPFAQLHSFQDTPAAATAGGGIQGNSSSMGLEADVQDWLLRAAWLEDELQGRAMEVAEDLQQLHEHHELFMSLATSLQDSTAGSAEREAADSAAADSLGVSRGAGGRGALYPVGGMASSPGIRVQVSAEVTRLHDEISKLQNRAARLGSALATLQGCQAVLASGKAARLSPCSRLAVLQLVLSDVTARLPGEQLQDLEVLEGLPSLDAAGREICDLAGARSLTASVQPLLQASNLLAAQQQAACERDDQVTPAVQQEAAATQAALHAAPAAAAVSAGGMELLPPADSQHTGLQVRTSSSTTATSGKHLSAQSGAASGRRRQRGSSLQSAGSGSHHHHHRTGHASSQPQQQQQPWYADLLPPNDDDDSDDDIMDSLSSVLSSRYYTPRPSLSYESRKAAAAAAAAAQAGSRQASLAAARSVNSLLPKVPAGSAAAADAAALTLAGIASSGSWSNWPADEANDACSSSNKHVGLWDMICVHSPRSTHSQKQQRHQLQPQSPSSVASSSRRAASRVGFGPSGLPYPLPSWPESPTAAMTAAARAGGGSSQAFDPFALPSAATADPTDGVGSWLPTTTSSQGLQLAGGVGGVYVGDNRRPKQLSGVIDECSRDSFDSCTTALSHFSCAAGDTTADGGAGRAGAKAQPNSSSRRMLSVGCATAAPASVPANAIAHDAPLSAALPAGTDLGSMTVGELLQALTTAVSGQQQ